MCDTIISPFSTLALTKLSATSACSETTTKLRESSDASRRVLDVCGQQPIPLQQLQEVLQSPHNVNLSVVDHEGNTPLHLAARSPSSAAVFLLLRAGANPNATNGALMSPLLSVVSNIPTFPDNLKGMLGNVLVLLLKAGATANAQDSEGESVLHWSMRCQPRQNIELTELLLRFGADPNRSNMDGETPLHLAATLGRVDVVSRLLDAGADPLRVDATGWTPLDEAKRNGQPQCHAMLQKKLVCETGKNQEPSLTNGKGAAFSATDGSAPPWLSHASAAFSRRMFVRD